MLLPPEDDELLLDELELEDELDDEFDPPTAVLPQLPTTSHTLQSPLLLAGLSPCVHQRAWYLVPFNSACLPCV